MQKCLFKKIIVNHNARIPAVCCETACFLSVGLHLVRGKMQRTIDLRSEITPIETNRNKPPRHQSQKHLPR